MSEFPPGSTRQSGQWAERWVAARVEEKGLSVVARNVEVAGAEIDLIARGHDGAAPLYVFIEVRSRASAAMGTPVETVGIAKRRRVVRAATAWLSKQNLLDRVAVRFDVVGVVLDVRPPSMEWIEGAFDVDD